MDPERLISELVGGFLGGKSSRRRGGFDLSSLAGSMIGGGQRTRGGLVNAGTLLTVGGLIWGAIETLQQGHAGRAAGTGVPPPLPPLPGGAPPPASAPEAVVPAALLPLVQLAVSAARADGDMSDDEVATIRARAAMLGAAGLVDAELAARRPLEAITPAFATPEQRLAAYALAWGVVHGPGDVSPGERMYLTQLQRLLTLAHDDVARLERDTLAGAGEP
jgi:uncharacterized membrane protein YebE (DUF533 family)